MNYIVSNWFNKNGENTLIHQTKNGKWQIQETKEEESKLLLIPSLVDLNAIIPNNSTHEIQAAHNNGISHILAMPEIGLQHQYNFYNLDEEHKNTYKAEKLTKNKSQGIIPKDYKSLNSQKVKALVITDEDLKNTKSLLNSIKLAEESGIKLFIQPNWGNLCGNAQVHQGKLATQKGLNGTSATSETLALQLILELVREIKSLPIHISGISSSRAIEIIDNAKQQGIAVTADTSINNLMFHDNDIEEFDTNFKLWPPLRDKKDRNAIRKAVSSGIIDAITSNHSPIDYTSKNLPFASASFGASTFDCFIPMLVYLHKKEVLSIEQIVKSCSINPAKIIDIKNNSAVIVDINKERMLDKSTWKSKGTNSPWFNGKKYGDVISVIEMTL